MLYKIYPDTHYYHQPELQEVWHKLTTKDSERDLQCNQISLCHTVPKKTGI